MKKPKKPRHTEEIRKEARQFYLSTPDDYHLDPVMVIPQGAEGRYKFSPHATKAEIVATLKKLGLEDNEPYCLEGIWFVAAKVTPKRAAKWLVDGNLSNRKITKAHAERLIRENRSGAMALTPQPLMFRKDGFTQDGQNRLYATMKGGNPVIFIIALNVSDEARRVIDTGKAREVSDWYFFATGTQLALANVPKATVQRAEAGLGKTDFTATEQGDLFMKYEDGLKWLFDPEDGLFRRRITGITNAGVMGALLRAYYYEDTARLEEFCATLESGEVSRKADRAAAVLWKQLSGKRTKATKSQVGLYGITCKAIQIFCNEEEPSQDYFLPPSKEIYAVVGDEEEDEG